MDTQHVILTMFGAVLGYLALLTFQHGKKLAVIEKTVDQMVAKMDLFLKTEIDTLKEIARGNVK